MSEAIALVGSETLMGREVRDLLSGTSLGADLTLIAGSQEAGGLLAALGGEAAVLSRLDDVSIEDTAVVILAGDPDSTRAVMARRPKGSLVDLTYVAEDDPRSRLRAPMVERYDLRIAPDVIHSVAHPAAIAITLILSRLRIEHELSGWVVHIFEPASELGASGVQELQEQTVSLLSFKPMPKKVFDSQLTFTMLARLGDEAPSQLQQVEARVERHLATLFQNAGHSPMPSFRVVQAPVYHGYSFSIWAEFAGKVPDVAQVEALLTADDISVHEFPLEPPNNVSIAGQDGISVGAITLDRNNPRAMWLWVAADNLRLLAQNAVAVARELI